MYRWLTAFAVILVLIAAVGVYRGWFTLSRSRSPSPENSINVNLNIDGDKIKKDVEFTRDATASPAK